jgi:hypothetical protein
MPGTNTLAYYGSELITAVKMFNGTAPSTNTDIIEVCLDYSWKQLFAVDSEKKNNIDLSVYSQNFLLMTVLKTVRYEFN